MSICISTVQLSPHHVQHGAQDVPGLRLPSVPAPEGSSVRGNKLPRRVRAQSAHKAKTEQKFPKQNKIFQIRTL